MASSPRISHPRKPDLEAIIAREVLGSADERVSQVMDRVHERTATSDEETRIDMIRDAIYFPDFQTFPDPLGDGVIASKHWFIKDPEGREIDTIEVFEEFEDGTWEGESIYASGPFTSDQVPEGATVTPFWDIGRPNENPEDTAYSLEEAFYKAWERAGKGYPYLEAQSFFEVSDWLAGKIEQSGGLIARNALPDNRNVWGRQQPKEALLEDDPELREIAARFDHPEVTAAMRDPRRRIINRSVRVDDTLGLVALDYLKDALWHDGDFFEGVRKMRANTPEPGSMPTSLARTDHAFLGVQDPRLVELFFEVEAEKGEADNGVEACDVQGMNILAFPEGVEVERRGEEALFEASRRASDEAVEQVDSPSP